VLIALPVCDETVPLLTTIAAFTAEVEGVEPVFVAAFIALPLVEETVPALTVTIESEPVVLIALPLFEVTMPPLIVAAEFAPVIWTAGPLSDVTVPPVTNMAAPATVPGFVVAVLIAAPDPVA